MDDGALPQPVVDLWRPCLFLRAIGLWAPARLRWLYSAYTVWSLLQLVVSVAGQLAGLQGHWDHLPTVATSVCLIVTSICTLFKASSFALRRGRVDSLVSRISHNLSTFCAHRPRTRAAVVWAARRRATRMFDTFLGIGGVALVFFYLGPIIQNAKDARVAASAAGNETLPPLLGRNLAMLLWWPSGQPVETPAYQLTYVGVCYWLMLLYLSTSTLDAFYVTVIIYLSSQLKVLNVDFLSITEGDDDSPAEETDPLSKRGGKHELEAKLPKGYEEATDQRTQERLLECIIFHQEIIKTVDEMESILSASILVQFLASTLVICFTAFVITTAENKQDLPTYITYLATMFYELFLYCWYGNELLAESERLQTSAYSCGWVGRSAGLQRSLRVVMVRLQRPVCLTAGKFYQISRETFLLLLNGSYSYFALLHQMNDH
uniref:Odorant receptor n=1 Tax=Locusta migratoria TaxID=7004 RepID=A0A0M4J2V7_LOCMI|nr:odorant receptor 83 [Locusta migratoria]